MTTTEPLGAEATAGLVRAGELSAVEAFAACLQRVREMEPQLQAFLGLLEEEGEAQAKELDRRRARGEELGMLAGVPVAIKDNLCLQGQPTTCGSRILEGFRAPLSATVVTRLQAEGAVILGRTNLDEFAMGSSTENSCWGPTHNPWDLGRVPGGSSGGSAATVASGGVPLALGSDTGGSVRQPAALCGIVGLRPTWGRVSRSGLVAFASSIDQVGPLTRNVRDSALALQILAGADPRDATSSPRPVDDYLGGIEDGIDGLRIGVPTQIETAELSSEVRAAHQRALSRLEELGARLVEISLPNLDAAVACYCVLATAEASANLARFDGVRYGRRAANAESLDDLYIDSRSEGFGAEVQRRVLLGTFALSSGYYEAYYGQAQGVREGLRRQMETAFQAVDLIATPTAPGGAFALGERTADPLAMYLSDVFTTPASLSGGPALALPADRDHAGLPLSLQLMAPPFAEALLLRAGRAFERAVDWTVEPSLAKEP